MEREYIVTDFYTIYRVVIYEDDMSTSITIDENFGERVVEYTLYKCGRENIFISTVAGNVISLPVTDSLVDTVLNLMQEILNNSEVMAEREIQR